MVLKDRYGAALPHFLCPSVTQNLGSTGWSTVSLPAERSKGYREASSASVIAMRSTQPAVAHASSAGAFLSCQGLRQDESRQGAEPMLVVIKMGLGRGNGRV